MNNDCNIVRFLLLRGFTQVNYLPLSFYLKLTWMGKITNR